jgi:hypothetical protein
MNEASKSFQSHRGNMTPGSGVAAYSPAKPEKNPRGAGHDGTAPHL